MKRLVWGQCRENRESNSLSRLVTAVVLGHWETPGEQVAVRKHCPFQFHPSLSSTGTLRRCQSEHRLWHAVIVEAEGPAGLELPGLIRRVR